MMYQIIIILILGAGGVVSSIIYALMRMRLKNSFTRRTKEKAEDLKKCSKILRLWNGENFKF